MYAKWRVWNTLEFFVGRQSVHYSSGYILCYVWHAVWFLYISYALSSSASARRSSGTAGQFSQHSNVEDLTKGWLAVIPIAYKAVKFNVI